MVNDNRDPRLSASKLRGKVVCRHDVERQSQCLYLAILSADSTNSTLAQIVHDLDQLPQGSWPSLRTSLLGLLTTFRDGPRPIRTQLCVCMANLAIQMLDWKDPIESVGKSLGSNGGDCVLEFLRVLPEEVTEGRKINLSVCDTERLQSWNTVRRTSCMV